MSSVEILYPRKTKDVTNLIIEGIYYHNGLDPLRFVGVDNYGKYCFMFLDHPELIGFATDNLQQIKEAA